jgi:hypothetical protein
VFQDFLSLDFSFFSSLRVVESQTIAHLSRWYLDIALRDEGGMECLSLLTLAFHSGAVTISKMFPLGLRLVRDVELFCS